MCITVKANSGAFVEGPDYAFSRWKPFKFKVQRIVDTKTIRFGSGSYFDGKTFDYYKLE